MELSFLRFEAVASRLRAPVVRHVREIILQKRGSFGCRNQNESESIQTCIEGPEMEIASKCAFVHSRTARRVSGVAGRCEKMWHGGAHETYVKLHYLANHSASSREFREFPRTFRYSVHLRSSYFSSSGDCVANLL